MADARASRAREETHESSTLSPGTMRILITGGAGFIGSHTADALAKKGHKIRILDNLEPPVHNRKWPSYISKNYELIKGSVAKKEDWLKALKNVDVVYALAAYQDQLPDYSKFFATNTIGAALFFEIAHAKKLSIKKFIFASTQFIYGDGRYQCSHNSKFFYPPFRPLEQLEKSQWEVLCEHGQPAKFLLMKEDQKPQPPNAYALSKVAKENLSFIFGRRLNIPTVGLRYSIVQGSRQSPRNAYSGSLRIFTTQALAGRDLTVYEDGHQLRDFINIHDVVAANLLVLENPKADWQIFNIGSGKGCTILDFVKLVKEVTKSSSQISVEEIFRFGDTRHAVSDISKVKKMGWRPRFGPKDSIKEYAEWLQKEWKGGFDFSSGALAKMKKLGIVKSVRFKPNRL